jgi:hypothetical protein
LAGAKPNQRSQDFSPYSFLEQYNTTKARNFQQIKKVPASKHTPGYTYEQPKHPRSTRRKLERKIAGCRVALGIKNDRLTSE